MKENRRQKTGKIAALLCLTLFLGGCGSAAETAVTEAETEDSVTVSTQTVETGTITLSNSFIGTISPEETVMVIPMAAGTVTETFYEVGDYVNAGDVLFKIDDEAARLQLENAQLNLRSAQQQADSALTTQQESADISMESNKQSAQKVYESYQIQYHQVKESYENADEAYDNAVKGLDALKKQLAAAQSSGSVSGSDPVDIAALTNKVKEMEATVASAKTARDTLYWQYLSARSGYHSAEDSLETLDKSEELAHGAALQDTKDQLQTSLSLAQLGVESAEMSLSYYTVTAPVSGTIESKTVEVNGMAAQGNPAYTIVNNNTMTVTFQVSEAVMNTLSLGQSVTIDRNGSVYQAAITEIGTSVNPQTGLFQIKGCVQANGSELPSGVSVKITADTYQASNAMLIPYDAVYYENEGAYVYTSVEGRAVKTPITTGIFDDDNIEVTGGLNVGDLVVTSWSPQLTDGVLLKAVEVKAEEP